MQSIKKIENALALAVCFLLFSLFSCRDEVIDPNNKAGNVNEPVILRSSNYYSFTIDAESITYNIVDETLLKEPESVILFSIKKYKSGIVEIYIIDKNLNLLFSKKLSSEVTASSKYISGYVPSKVVLYFKNFSGILRLEVVSTI